MSRRIRAKTREELSVSGTSLPTPKVLLSFSLEYVSTRAPFVSSVRRFCLVQPTYPRFAFGFHRKERNLNEETKNYCRSIYRSRSQQQSEAGDFTVTDYCSYSCFTLKFLRRKEIRTKKKSNRYPQEKKSQTSDQKELFKQWVRMVRAQRALPLRARAARTHAARVRAPPPTHTCRERVHAVHAPCRYLTPRVNSGGSRVTPRV